MLQITLLRCGVGWQHASATHGSRLRAPPSTDRPDGIVSRVGTTRDRILDAAEVLIAQGHVPPSLDAVAAAAGVSKGGVLYHFGKRSLLDALGLRAIEQMDAELSQAAERGQVAATWLLQSVPDEHRLRLYRGMLAMLRLTAGSEIELREEVSHAVLRWQRLLEDELGDVARARLVRLVGDGLFLNALTGDAPTAAAVAAVAADLGIALDPAR